MSAELINVIVEAMEADPTYANTVRAEMLALAKEITTGGEGNQVISGSGNGMSYTVLPEVTPMQRLRILRAAVKYFDGGGRASATTYAIIL